MWKAGALAVWISAGGPGFYESLYAGKLVGVGFERGVSTPVVFVHKTRDLAGLVHGDDFVFEGAECDLRWIQALIQEWFDVKVRGLLGPEPEDMKEITILGRTIRWKEWGIEYEADRRHREKVLEYFGLNEESKGLRSNGIEKECELEGAADSSCDTEYRGLVARLNYLSQDCPDLLFPTMKCSRGMANPGKEDWARLKRLARYLLVRRAVIWEYRWQKDGCGMRVVTDSDWGGCLKTRKSCSGGVVMRGDHCIRVWCSSQGAVAVSSAEAEYYSMVEGVMKAIGVRRLGEELGIVWGKVGDGEIGLGTDSSAAKALASRRGAGKMTY